MKACLDIRKNGTVRIPPETLTNDSPLIRNECRNKVHPVRPHSLRKYFRTQLGAISTIPTDYIDYMMEHTVNTYNDIRMKGMDFLRNLYASSRPSIKPRTKISKIDRLKMFLESLGLNPDEVISKDALTSPHRTVADPESRKIELLNETLKHAILQELRNA